MGKNKLQRFREITRFNNVLELTDFKSLESRKPKGKWHSEIFQNHKPIILELGCGKGAYTLELASRNPSKNYIGLDIKGSRLWKGAQKALDENLENVRFLRIYIDHLDEYFAPEEADEIWIAFPDPYLKGSNRRKRLTSIKFLDIYKKVLKKNGIIHFKTDSEPLFHFTIKSLEKYNCHIHRTVDDIYEKASGDDLLTIKTDFENRHLKKGKAIKYICFSLPV